MGKRRSRKSHSIGRRIARGSEDQPRDDHGRFGSGDGGAADDHSNQLTSDELDEFTYAVQSTTDLDGNIQGVSEHAQEMAGAADDLQSALEDLNMSVDDEDGDSQIAAADAVHTAYDAMKTFSAAAEKSLASATQAAADAKKAQAEFEKYMKEFGIAPKALDEPRAAAFTLPDTDLRAFERIIAAMARRG